MEVKHYIAIIVRVFSIVIFLHAINSGVSVVPLVGEQSFKSAVYFQIASSSAIILIAIFLWFFPLTVASGLLPKPSTSTDSFGKLKPIDFQLICFTSIGFYLLFNVVSDIVFWSSYLFFFDSSQFDSQEVSALDKASIITTVIEFIVLVPLLMNLKGFILVLNKLRYGG